MAATDYTVVEDSPVNVCVELTSLPAGGLEINLIVILTIMDGTQASMWLIQLL